MYGRIQYPEFEMPPDEILEHTATQEEGDGVDHEDEEDYAFDLGGGHSADPNSAEAEHLVPLHWHDVREESYDSFLECMSDWEEKAKIDANIDLVEKFNFSSIF